MKYNEGKPEGDSGKTRIKDSRDESNEEVNRNLKCPNCTMLMTSFQDISVQCDLLTDEKCATFLDTGSKMNRSRHGSMTEVMEEVPFNENVEANDIQLAQDEIVLVTRSFETEAPQKQPQRSSIAVILDAIKALRMRGSSEAPRMSNRDGYNGESNEKAKFNQEPSTSFNTMSSNELLAKGKDVHRKSFQLDNGTIVDEQAAEYDAGKAVSTNEENVPGEVNFISRSFEIVHENPSQRRESLIDKINPFKIIERIRKGSNNLAPNANEARKSEPEEPIIGSSGIRRKSLTPALLIGGTAEEGKNENGKYADYDTDSIITGNDQLSMYPARYVTNGVRRGSVAAVTAAPPCRNMTDDEPTKRASLDQSNLEDTENARLVTTGIRRGSVAMVSAAPPCINADDTCLPTTELRVEGDVLRSGVRRRSLAPANEGSGSSASSPIPVKQPTYEWTQKMTSSDSVDGCDKGMERRWSDAADEFMNRVEKRYNVDGKEKKHDMKGAVGLFEELTGRKMGVDYATIDAKSIQKKFDEDFEEKERERQAQRKAIPVITFSEDTMEDDAEKEALDKDDVVDEEKWSGGNAKEKKNSDESDEVIISN